MAYSGIILERNGKYLLHLRDGKAPTNPNKWSTFGGGIEKNEAPLDCIIREIKEELGVKLLKNDVKFLIKSKYNNQDFYVFIAKFNHDIKDLQLNEGADMKFFSKEDIFNSKDIVDIARDLFILV